MKTESKLAKRSFSVELSCIFLAGMLVLTVIISTIFVLRMRELATEQIEAKIQDQIAGIRSSLILTFKIHEDALFHAASGISLLYGQTGETYLNARAIAQNDMRAFLQRFRDILPNVAQIHVSNNIPTFEEGGYFVLSPDWNFGDDFDQRTRPWYIGAKDRPGVVNYSDPYVLMALGVMATSLSTVLYDNNHNDLGTIDLDIAVKSLTDIVVSFSNIEGLQSWLLNREGLYISNENTDAVMRDNFFNDHSLPQYRQQILNQDSFYVMDSERIICSSRIPGAEWVVVSVIPRSIVFAEVNRSIYTTVLLAAIIIIVLVIVLAFIVRRSTRPIVTIVQALKDISEGEGDLTRAIGVNVKNEIGDLAHYFNLTLEKIKNLVKNIKKEAVTLSEIGAELTRNMNETVTAAKEITSNVQSAKDRILNHNNIVGESHAAMDRTVTSINKLNTQVENQSKEITQASSAIEEMVANIQSVTGTLVNNAVNVKALRDASEVGHSGLSNVAEDIQGIARESEGLLEINSVMENIASQTNLLSMNAAIEAAHAGESGKGFAVVADEIRKLAESSSVQSKTIGMVLKKIKESIDKMTSSTQNVLDKFEAINSNIKTVTEQEESIRNAMEEQGIGSKQLLQGVSNVNGITRQVKSDSHEMLEDVNGVIKEDENLARVTNEITSGMDEVASGAMHINKAIDQVNEISRRNHKGIDTLMSEVSRFKVD